MEGMNGIGFGVGMEPLGFQLREKGCAKYISPTILLFFFLSRKARLGSGNDKGKGGKVGGCVDIDILP